MRGTHDRKTVGTCRVSIGDLVEGRYRILDTLGEGGMGSVFLAEHTLIKRRFAMKILHAELATDADVVERFMNEARAAGTLGHPNIVESTDMGFTHDHVPYVVFEHLEGTLLTDEIYRVGGLPVRRAIRIAQQIASALDAAHSANVVHRDLKSDNIFLTDKDGALDHVKVLDFGIARFLMLADAQQSVVMGTPEYMAPEQLTTPEQVDARADIYALGVILYEMLAARRPFAGDDVLEKIVRDAPAPLPDVPVELAQLITQCMLAKDPEQRLQSMQEVGARLEELSPADVARPARSRTNPAMDSMAFPRPATLPPRATTAVPVQRAPWLLYGIAAAGAAIGVVGTLVGLRGEDPPAKVAVELGADVADARVTFRHRVVPAPSKLELVRTDIVELVEVGAAGYKTTRYWLTVDRPLRLTAHLEPGSGLVEATDAQTAAALVPGHPATASR